ncbi:hypothetical protein LVY65_09770 [Sphingomonas sp. G124]|uniref:Uncharacterized protein n=1 Tax=Sphingomonas cremea TaxID=2904799 RepID=A0A9X1TWG8_9SPHN|nr:hypothetical protein [Sphingomonas cremea]MCF2515349.1 hypothetical protein [Sphingomonas cremea]
MKHLLIFGTFLVCGALVSAQPVNRGTTRVAVPQQSPPAAVDQSAVQVPVADEPAKAKSANPISNPRSGFVGKLPAIARTFVYPPGEGEYKFEAAGLSMGEDGYYSPTDNGNSFFMWFPRSAMGMPLSIACSVRRQPFAFGTLSWANWGGSPGGGVAFRFGPGETEARYQTNFTNGDASLVMFKVWVPPDGGLKECRVTGTFEQE